MGSKIIKEDGRALLLVDDEVICPVAYMTYNPITENYSSFAEIGTKLFSFGVYLGDQPINSESGIKPFRRGFYRGYSYFDFEEVKRDLEKMTAYDDTVYIIPRIYLDCPTWWEWDNPEELSIDARGETVRQSFASEKWRNDTLKALYAFIDFINNSKWRYNIIGYQVAAAGTEEWLYHHKYPNQFCDYSECNLAKYIDWLKEKYIDIDLLNRAWHTRYASFRDIRFPTPFERAYSFNGVLRDPDKEMHVIDFYTYHNHIMADTIEFFCKNIKEYTNWNKITGAFYGYVCEVINHDLGHHAIHELIGSEYIDFFASPNSYMLQRSPGIDWPYMAAVDSARLHGKMWFIESDTRTSLTRSLKESMPEVAPDSSRYTLQGVWKGPDHNISLSMLKKGFGKILTGQIGTWWFDMWGGWFNDPQYMDFIKKSMDIMYDHIDQGIKPRAEIAVFVDSKSYSYFSLDHYALYELVYNQREALGLMGAPYHLYLTDDITHRDFDVDGYKLFIFLNNVVIDEDTRNEINYKLKRKGKTLLWVFLQDYFSSISVTDFDVVYNKESGYIQAEYKDTVFPASWVQCPEFSEYDISTSRIIARQKDGNRPVCAVKSFDYNSIYCTVPGLSAKLLTDIADLSGVHIYCYSQDVIYADSRYIFFHAKTAGDKKIYLPQKARLYDALTDELVSDTCPYYDFKAEQYETRIFTVY